MELFSSFVSDFGSHVSSNKSEKEYNQVVNEIKNTHIRKTIPSYKEMFAELQVTDFSQLEKKLEQ